MMEQITSIQNPKIKLLMALQQKSSERRKSGLFVVEGRQEVEHCLAAGYTVDTVFYCPDLDHGDSGNHGDRLFQDHGVGSPDTVFAENWIRRTDPVIRPAAPRCFAVSKDVYERIAYRGSTEGIIAEVRQRTLSLDDLQLSDRPLIVVLESVEKPGNLGAILRSADAAGADAVVVCDPLTDLYNPNLIRSSVGAAFTVPCVACSSDDCIRFLKQRGIRILTAQLQDSHLYYATDMTAATAIVMGTEHAGLTPQWRQAADAHIRIPMLGRVDSLNVSVSAAILLFEAVRQRQR